MFQVGKRKERNAHWGGLNVKKKNLNKTTME